MKISVDISLYPFAENYEKPILDFIQKLNTFKELEVNTNPMSTQIVGEADLLLPILHQLIIETFKEDFNSIFTVKYLKKGE